MEFINNNITSRNKLYKYFSLGTAFLLISFCLKFVLAPTDVQEGIRHSRRMLSYNEFIIFSSMAVFAYLISGISTKIILKLIVDENKKTLYVEMINRFKFKTNSYTVKLSETQISQSIIENKGTKITSLILNNKDFGTLTINSLDFNNIEIVVNYFENLKKINAQQLRQKRLLKKKNQIT